MCFSEPRALRLSASQVPARELLKGPWLTKTRSSQGDASNQLSLRSAHQTI